MSNNLNLATDFAATNALIVTVDNVVDAIRGVDVTGLALGIANSRAVVDANAVILADLHDTDIPAIATLTDKERSLMGLGVYPGFSEDFDKVADAADPSATNWTVTENGGGTVNVRNNTTDVAGFARGYSGIVVGEDGLCSTRDKRVFALKNGVTEIHLAARLRFLWNFATGENCGIGFMANEIVPGSVTDLVAAANHVVSVVVHDNLPMSFMSNGANVEETDLSAYVAGDTWLDLEIILRAASADYWINGTLRNQKTTFMADSVFQLMFGGTCFNAGDFEYIDIEKLHVWCV
ncbi:hypothetical protein ES707_14235 [subsurface metagenome]